MALHQHLRNTGRTAKVPIDLERRMGIKQVGISSPVLSLLFQGGPYLLSDQFISMVPSNKRAQKQTFQPIDQLVE